jgi:hypothetical protein
VELAAVLKKAVCPGNELEVAMGAAVMNLFRGLTEVRSISGEEVHSASGSGHSDRKTE